MNMKGLNKKLSRMNLYEIAMKIENGKKPTGWKMQSMQDSHQMKFAKWWKITYNISSIVTKTFIYDKLHIINYNLKRR